MFSLNASLFWQLVMQLSVYLIGSIPFAVVIPWLFYGLDVRLYGSKNPGTTNVYRTVRELQGKTSAIIVASFVGLCDLLKGILVCLIPTVQPQTNGLWSAFGHMCSPFLGFSGGKAAATFMGSIAGATWNPLFLIPPVLWIFTTFTNIPTRFFGLVSDWIVIGPIKIKKSFLVSGFCMLLSLMLFMLSMHPWYIKLQFVAVFLVICIQHADYISLAK